MMAKSANRERQKSVVFQEQACRKEQVDNEEELTTVGVLVDFVTTARSWAG